MEFGADMLVVSFMLYIVTPILLISIGRWGEASHRKYRQKRRKELGLPPLQF